MSACRHWLSGLVKCSVCGASLGYNKHAQPFFQCWKYAKGMHPGSSWITEKTLVNGVIEYFERLLDGEDFDFTLRIVSVSNEPDDTEVYTKELKKLELRESRIREAYEAGIDTLEEYKSSRSRLADERMRINALLQEAEKEAQRSEAEDRRNILSKIRTVNDVLKSDAVDYETKGTFMRSIVEKIVWNRQENTLTFHLYLSEES